MMKISQQLVNDLQLHQEALATPMMSKLEYQALKDDIEQQGQLDPITVYRGKIVDGRHRWLILKELGIPTITVDTLPHNTTLEEIKTLVRSKELRRHETAAQLAIRAYRQKTASNSPYRSFAAAAKAVGANVKRVSEANRIATYYGRPDILDVLFDGKKLEIGASKRPFQTDSLNTILRWLEETSPKTTETVPSFEPRELLTDSEQVIVSRAINAITKESLLVQKEIADILYRQVVGENTSH